jgi:hypothetical protein
MNIPRIEHILPGPVITSEFRDIRYKVTVSPRPAIIEFSSLLLNLCEITQQVRYERKEHSTIMIVVDDFKPIRVALVANTCHDIGSAKDPNTL